MNEAYEERDTLRARVGASEEEDGTIKVGFAERTDEASASAAPPVVAAAVVEKEREKELVGAGAAAVNDFED